MDKALRIVVLALPVIIVSGLLVLAQFQPGLLINPRYLAGMIFLQVLLVCLWFYDRLYFPLLMVVFLWAGMDVPFSETWTAGRWVVLAAGATVGFIWALKSGIQRYHLFHLVASLCVVTAMVSAMKSPAPQFSIMKACSLLLLFMYAGFGARLLLRNPDRYFRMLLLASEGSVYVSGFFYLMLGREIWGNPNSLGAVEGVIAAPLLLWGALVAPEKSLRMRRAAACVGALYLVYFSITRAAMLASAVSMLALLFGLRRRKLLWSGILGIACIVAITAIFAPGRFEEYKESVITGVVYKGHQEQGLLGSRLTPWKKTVQVIQANPFFGSGFGATRSGDKPFGEEGRLASTFALREHGSSYLAITEYVGLIGVVPFALLILLVVQRIGRVIVWMRRTGSPYHYSVPIMMVLTAGLVHAGFEDWMFAVGYYLTVLYWTSAFLLMDLAPDPAPYQSAVLHGMRFHYSTSTATVPR